MKLALGLLIGLVACAVQAQSTNTPAARGDPTLESDLSRPLRLNAPAIRQAKPNEIITSRVSYEGIVVAASKHHNILQLINPFAPAEYGSAADNTVHDPVTGRPSGLKIFQIKF